MLVDQGGKIVWQYGQFGVIGCGPNQLNMPVQNTFLPSAQPHPDWDELMSDIAQHTPQLAIFTCGRHPLMVGIKRSAQAQGWPVRTEKFG